MATKISNVLALFAITVLTLSLFPESSRAEGTSLKDQLIGTWIYVSSAGKREDGNNVQRPNLQGAVTYTADGRFHFITTPTDMLRYASNDPNSPFAGRGYGHGIRIDCLHRHIYCGRKHKNDPYRYRDEHVSKSRRSS